jgi:hypothetical protein
MERRKTLLVDHIASLREAVTKRENYSVVALAKADVGEGGCDKWPDGCARRSLGEAWANHFWFTEANVKPKNKKYFASVIQKYLLYPVHPVPLRGAYHDRSRTWGGSRWTLAVPIANGMRAYGKDVWS